MRKAIALSDSTTHNRNAPAIGVFVAGDPRIDAESRQRCRNICQMVADVLAERVKLPDGSPAKVVWAPILVDGEAQADLVAKQFQDAGVKVLACSPDTWAFPQLSVISLLSQFPADTPINFTCGNSGPKPGVVFCTRGERCDRAIRQIDTSQRGHLARHRPESGHDRGHRMPDRPGERGGGQQPLDLSALARGDAGAGDGGGAPAADQLPQVAAPSGDAVADYKAAYELFVSGQYASAETAFRQFLGAYPGDSHAPDATYWLGQSLFSRAMYREAALEFVNSHKLYPKSARAADTMLLLGKSLAGIPERDAACQTFAAALKQYPTMSNALRQRVITEQANAGC